MKIYTVTGYLIILVYMLACMYSAPGNLGPWTGLGIAHRSLDYKEWFIKLVTVVNNTFAIYVDPIAWSKSPSVASQEC